ncbi:hypothetical protein Tco_0619233 [Tanacetum coccineum]
MAWFEQLELHLHDLYLHNAPYAVDAFKPAFCEFFSEEHQTFKLKMFHNLDQLRLQLRRENLHEVNANTCLDALRTQFKEFLASKGVNSTDHLNYCWQQDFEDYTRCEPGAYRRDLLENLDTLEAVFHRVVNTYGILRMKENEVNELSHFLSSASGKGFCKCGIKNELRKIKGNSVDTKFAKASILGKPSLEPSRNHLVVRQPNAFTSERPRISRPRFASQVDEKNDLSKTITPHYLPKVRESAPVKPHHVNAHSDSRNSQMESYGSNDMAHTYFLEDARKMTQDKTRIPNHRDMASTRAHCTLNACTPKPRNIYRSSPVSKCSGGMSNGEPLVDHSRNSSFFLDSKQFICSICHKCIFNANHDDCITKILKKVNSRAKGQSLKIKNNKPVEPKNHTHKPGRQIGIGQRFSLNKSSAVHEKPHTPRSCIRWKPMSRTFKTVSLRWIPTGKVFIDSTTKVNSEPPNGSNDDITNPYECNQTLYVSAGKSNSSAGLAPQCLKTFEQIGSSLVLQSLMMFDQISSNLVSQMSQRRPLASLQASFLKDKKGVRFSALYLQKKRNLLVLDHSHQQESKKTSKRQPRTGGSNKGTGNIPGVPDESKVVSGASIEGTGSRLGVPDD